MAVTLYIKHCPSMDSSCLMREKAFSILELLVVMVISGVLLGAMAISFQRARATLKHVALRQQILSTKHAIESSIDCEQTATINGYPNYYTNGSGSIVPYDANGQNLLRRYARDFQVRARYEASLYAPTFGIRLQAKLKTPISGGLSKKLSEWFDLHKVASLPCKKQEFLWGAYGNWNAMYLGVTLYPKAINWGVGFPAVDQATKEALCQTAGYAGVKSAYNTGFKSCGNDTLSVFRPDFNQWNIVGGCAYGGAYFAGLQCWDGY
jgi:prepilin-type N-terminal cleavage/methylation domain-containing protein